MIEVDGLEKAYGDLTAVQGLSFQVRPGEVVGLVGPNGAGKTTTLRCLAGITVPTAGRIRIAGHDLAAEPVAAKQVLAFIPDEPHLFEYLTVEEHLRFVGRLYGVADAPERIPRMLAELELEGKRRALPGELSRGMRQKLAIACGLLHDPAVLLFDEPLTGLDPVSIRRMKATIVARAMGWCSAFFGVRVIRVFRSFAGREAGQFVYSRRGRRFLPGLAKSSASESMRRPGPGHLIRLRSSWEARTAAPPSAAAG